VESSPERRFHPFSILCPVSPALLELDNMSAYLPTGLDLNRIHAAQNLFSRALNQLTQTTQQRSKIHRSASDFDQFVCHTKNPRQ
jgi:hypothetical protein